MRFLAVLLFVLSLLAAGVMAGLHWRLAEKQARFRTQMVKDGDDANLWRFSAKSERESLDVRLNTDDMAVESGRLELHIAGLSGGVGMAKAQSDFNTALEKRESDRELKMLGTTGAQEDRIGNELSEISKRLSVSVSDANRGLAFYSRWMYGLLVSAGVFLIVSAILFQGRTKTQAA